MNKFLRNAKAFSWKINNENNDTSNEAIMLFIMLTKSLKKEVNNHFEEYSNMVYAQKIKNIKKTINI